MSRYWSIWAYPWDFAEDAAGAAREIQSLGVSEVRIAVSYHRAQAITPRSQTRRLLNTSDGIHFSPDLRAYTGTPLHPIVLDQPVGGAPAAIAACREAGLGVSAWVVLLNNETLATRHPEYVTRNAWGDPLPFALCPAHPEVVHYAVALVGDVAENLGVDAIDLEGWHYYALHHHWLRTKSALALNSWEIVQASLCFCAACRDQAKHKGIDADRLAHQIRAGLAPDPVSQRAYEQMRCDVVNRLVATLKQAARQLPVRLFGGLPAVAPGMGIEYALIAPLVDGITVASYAPDPAQVQVDASAARAAVGPTAALNVSLGLADPDAPGRLPELIHAAQSARPSGISLYHFGMATTAGLTALQRLVRSS